jgi:hypothetical protein
MRDGVGGTSPFSGSIRGRSTSQMSHWMSCIFGRVFRAQTTSGAPIAKGRYLSADVGGAAAPMAA